MITFFFSPPPHLYDYHFFSEAVSQQQSMSYVYFNYSILEWNLYNLYL